MPFKREGCLPLYFTPCLPVYAENTYNHERIHPKMNRCHEHPQPQISDYITRGLVEEDSRAPNGVADTIRVAAGEEGGGLYTRGSFMESGIEKMDVFLFKKVTLLLLLLHHHVLVPSEGQESGA